VPEAAVSYRTRELQVVYCVVGGLFACKAGFDVLGYLNDGGAVHTFLTKFLAAVGLALVFLRVWLTRVAVDRDAAEIVVVNFFRTHHLKAEDVARVECQKNVTGRLCPTLITREGEAIRLTALQSGTSSQSCAEVTAMVSQLNMEIETSHTR
jgi:hypothetical protein